MPALLILLTACPAPCEGPGCDAEYSATTLAVHEGSRALALRSEQAPLASEHRLSGGESLGQDWALHLGPEGLLLGLPEADQVRSTTLEGLARGEHGRLEGPAGSRFGADLAVLGDALVVGAPDLDPGEALPEAGGVFLLEDLGAGFEGTVELEAALRLAGEAPFDHLGQRVVACGDMDGDGLGELALAAPWDQTSATLSGRVHLFTSGEGLSGEQPVGALGRSWGSPVVGAALGRDLDCSWDLDGDGEAELLLGSPFDDSAAEAAGAVFLAPMDSEELDAASAWTGEQDEDWLGWSLAVGDLDGDGLPELAVGLPGASDGDGAVWVYAGEQLAAGGRSPQFRIEGSEREHLGRHIELVDLDDDGRAELLAGAPRHDPGEAFAAGALYVFRGREQHEGWSRIMTSAEADGSFVGDRAFLRTGERFATGDLDGDGLPELALALEVLP